MDQKRTLTMNWEGLLAEDEDDDQFFESYSRISSAVSHDAAGSSDSDSDEEEYEDGRISFASALTSASIKSFHSLKSVVTTPNAVVASPSPTAAADYNLWMAEPGSITERRKRLLHDMGLSSNRDLLRITSSSRRKVATILAVDSSSPLEESKGENSPSPSPSSPSPSPSNSNSNSTPVLLVRSRSDGDIDSFSASAKQRKEELIGPVSKQRLTRTLSGSSAAPCTGAPRVISPKKSRRKSSFSSPPTNNGKFSSFFLIKNLDTGKEFIVKEFNEEGMWNKLSDLQTGKQLTMEEFEKSLGYSPVVKELMRRETVSKQYDDGRKVGVNSYLSKSFRNSKRRGVALLKNIKGVATTMSGLMADKEREPPQSPPVDHRRNTQWVKVRQQGKSYKEFTAMHLSQEIQAHEGSIWTVRFSLDARYLASAGEDKVIRVWEVQDCEVMTTRPPEDFYYSNSTPLHPSACSSPDVPLLGEAKLLPSERGSRRGKVGSNRKKSSSSIPDYVHMPEAVFALSERPVCTFKGHLEDVLDLSWSKSQLLLSSSMDKTVRLWDMETRSCLKLFAHNDYVTCIQFNPVDDDYFISGSLDAKVRIWNIPDRQVVDWTDVHEMVTAACYTPDGQGALIGSHKGSCHYYGIFDCKIEEKDDINIRHKKKSQAKKITGFQFSPCNTYEVIITSADSRIRIFDGSDIVHKFKGFRNTSSQISASFTPDGKYIVSASEDSHVYIWRHDDLRNSGSGKSKNLVTTQSHEHFQCRDVSVAIPWPGSIKFEPPTVEVHSKRHSRRSIPQPNSSGGSPTRENSNLVGTNSKGQLPPLPKRSNRLERLTSYPDEDLAQHSHTDSAIGIGDSFNSATNSSRFGESPSISASGCSPSQSWSSSWSWFDNSGSQGGQTVQATAWGMVIVTAGLGGEIRVYQNFGLPLKVGR